jgi:salicylate hydroxylase
MKIIMIGAGIGGLTLAAALRRFSPKTQVDIFERDASPTSRMQGYSLGLKGDAGLMVLKTLGLYESLAHNAVTITNFVFADQRGQTLLELPATGDESRLTQRVQRQILKATLREAIGDTPIHYDQRCTSYRQDASGVEVGFESGTSATADYLVACDGAGSVVRQQMIGDEKNYLGLAAIVGDAPVTLKHPLLDGGYFMTLGDDGSSVFCYRQTNGVHLSFTVNAPSETALSTQTPAAWLQRLQVATQHWHAPIPDIARNLDPATLTVRGYYDKAPASHVRDRRVWLIGDAAHPMCPFQGQGANMAMVDALKLARYFGNLATKPTEAEANAQLLAQDIVARGRKAVLESRNAAKQFHTTRRFQQFMHNVGFWFGNFFIKLFSRK